jgi:hypothetical protein
MSLTETTHAGGHILSEANGNRSRENGTLLSGNNLAAAAVLHATLAAGAATAVGTPTGNGVITVGALGVDAQSGSYKLRCVAAATNAGTFDFEAPDGSLIRQITVGGGATASDHITLTIADGATDFVVGDTYTITVTVSGYAEFVAGTNSADAVLYAGVNATSANAPCVVHARDCELNGNELVWHSGTTDNQKATAAAQLASRGIVIRN